MHFILAIIAATLVFGCSYQGTSALKKTSSVTPPVAEKIPHALTMHGDTRVDNYYWMRDDSRTNEAVLSHLKAENRYVDEQLAHTQALQQRLFNEIKGRIVKDDSSVPTRKGPFYYSSEVTGDNEYAVYVRATDAEGTDKQVLIDANQLAKAHDYFSIGGLSVSPDNNLLAYGEDTLSRRVYTLRVKNLTTLEYLPDVIENTAGYAVWQNDNQAFYYVRKDPQTLLGYQVYRHRLGQPQSEDQLVYEEPDSSYFTFMGKSKDRQEIYIYHSSTETSGVSILDANDPEALPIAFFPREDGVEYEIAKLGEWYFIYTNYQAVNFRLMKVHASQRSERNQWQDVIAPQEHVQLVDFTLFNDHLVYEQRENGLARITVRRLSTGDEFGLQFNDTAFTAYLADNHELDSDNVRVYYTSMTTPVTYYDFSLADGKRTLLKQTKVLGDFEPQNYRSERLMIAARDGQRIPVTLVYRQDQFKKDGTNPLYQYAYGSYGHTIEPGFSSTRLSLLDRGFVYAIAHIRGSEMLGRPWYEDGKKLNKQNTFNDFIDVTRSLIDQGYAASDKVFAVGGSAGGLLMGAVVNQAPHLYHGVAAHVPFVDVVTTMLDESLPLTTNEYDEWGNPNEKLYYDYILSYSPYDNVSAQAYPNMLVTTGLHDSQVQYFEPMKWVAKLREFKTDDNILLFKTDLDAGHGGASGRFKPIREDALEYAFFLDLLNIDA
ncbi:S9 family peptidase [Vibrio sp. V39_P1S14PM300]|uniref:S9 family peptidase n=1 Tax=Vibrio sp. V39_P1S14PM300 TaxID=1938690 RepID=UPI00137285CD|nr:prolyl oligopeptidase family serine peptidase [Vibrio sp. V39_P1S14PM300]